MPDAEERTKRQSQETDTLRCSRGIVQRGDGKFRTREKEIWIWSMEKQITHKSQSISFISRMYLHHPVPLSSTRPRENSLLKNHVLGRKQFLMEINVRRKIRRRQERISIRWTNLKKLLTKIHFKINAKQQTTKGNYELYCCEDMKGNFFCHLFQRRM